MDITMIRILWARELRHREEKFLAMEWQSWDSVLVASSGTPLTHSLKLVKC